MKHPTWHPLSLAVLGLWCFLARACCSDIALSQPRIQPRNFDLFDSASREAALSFQKQLRSPRFPTRTANDTLRIHVHNHEAAWLLEQALFSVISVKKRFRPQDTLMPHQRLVVRVADASVRYFACENDIDAVTREVSCVVHATLETHFGTIQELDSYTKTHRDTLQRRTITSIENKQYAFTQATVPDAPPNFWKQVVEPAIVIAAAGIMVALFFFVRTQ
jgi:hypothetical protein